MTRRSGPGSIRAEGGMVVWTMPAQEARDIAELVTSSYSRDDLAQADARLLFEAADAIGSS